VFKGDVSLAAATEFAGDVFVADTKKITLTSTAAIITLKPGVELGHGAATGTPSTDIPAVYKAILANFETNGDVTLTPVANTVLTFGGPSVKTLTQSGAADHGITVGGVATLVPDATYTVASASGAVGTLTVAGSSALHIGKGILGALKTSGVVGSGIANVDDNSASLVLTGATGTDGAKLAGAGSLVAGGTTIVGGTALQAVGVGNVTIAANSISGTSVLTDTEAGSANVTITVAADSNLTIAANTTVDIGAKGSIVLGYKGGGNTTAGTITLADTTAVIKVGTGVTTGSATTAQLTAAFTGGVVGTGVTGKTTTDNSDDGTLTQLIGADQNNTVSGPDSGSSDFTIDASIVVSSKS
jgi:hypothetical protein